MLFRSMGTNRWSLLFKPGTYGTDEDPLQIRVGYTTEVAGLGADPGYLAMPALAALLLTTAWNMSEPHKWSGYWAAPVSDKVLLVLTLVLTVLADLTVAIGVGVGLGLALRLRDSRLQTEDCHTPER